MELVKDILNKKKDVWTVQAKSSVFDALVVMKEKDIGALIFTDESGKVLGIMSERDYARRTIFEGKSSK